MTNENVQLYWHDKILQKTLLRLIPSKIRPNHLTVLRVLMTPFVLYYLYFEIWEVAVPLFLLAALTDALDGSVARTRKQITLWGTIADPVADKILIGTVVILFVAREISLIFAGIIVFVELLIVLNAINRRRKNLGYVSANWFGKIKMLLQVAGVVSLLIARWSGVDFMVPFSVGTLSLAIVFALISLYTYGL